MATRIYFPGRSTTASSRFPVQHGFTAAELTDLQIACNQIALEAENAELSFEQTCIAAERTEYLSGGASLYDEKRCDLCGDMLPDEGWDVADWNIPGVSRVCDDCVCK